MSTAKATKKSAFSCEPCRRRKVKCGGEQPICQRCAARNDECIYKLNPTLSYTQRLEERIKELEDQVAHLSKSPLSVAGSAHSSPPLSTNQDGSTNVARHTPDEQGVTRSFKSLKVDDKGSITYHGATSFFNLPSDRNGNDLSDTPFMNSSSDTDNQRRERLISNAWHQRAMENLSEIPEPFQYLLNVHWCWIQPLFNFIYRPVFTRDMQLMGPYYSHTLLNAVISHSIRWGRSDPSTRRLLDESYQGGTVFGKHARNMLFQELNAGVCTIPTIQTLLLLSAQECSLGNSTQAWTYSGIAFRLIDHLGICVDSQRFPGSVPLSDEELEIRRRIYWGCYFWDKLICLYLGRSPSLQHTNISPSHIMFDDSAENDLWVPFGIPQTDPAWKYPPTTAHSASCFISMCRLSVIFNEILVHMYDPLSQNTDAEIQECLDSQEPLLQQWWDQLPIHLKIDPVSLPNLAPPSHIVTLNCLYHAFKILLYRPMLTGRGRREAEGTSPIQRYLVESVTSATSIIAIFDLFCRTFSMNYCVLSLAYCVYIASSIFLLQVQAAPDDHQAMRKLTYCIQCLQQVRQISPVIASALNNINKELTAIGIPIGNSPQLPPRTRASPPAGSSVPISGSVYQSSPEVSRPMPGIIHPIFQPSFSHNFGPDAMSMEPAVFETMSTLEPLSIRVGAIQESENQSKYG
ncbi:hypothetical protein QQS21_007964 [Conoideocrella luteorostrata]|uniref:Zn(2)-C6 fungal-type domain-containing protein n=1 Tax=Conoideocrella luteorostrata TaxID=1105319 RepID=A0AAJ0CMG5_9HYPO|nr:hypothetical protein QQS21_007964 [Conoideocrella luteorostrata]